jgi:pimeloyl-ACP methyl ester carboxylesterase
MHTVSSHDGTPIAYDRYGDGPPVILIGGAMSTREAATGLAGALAAHLAVIAYDRRGRGDSGDTLPYAVEREIEDLAALVEVAGGSAALFGHSSGAAIALEATLRGVPVTRLALYEPPFLIDPGRPPLSDDYRERQGSFIAEGRPGDAVEQFMREAVLVPDAAIADMRRSPSWPAFESLARTLPYDQAVMDETSLDDPDPLRRFEPIRVPTLAIDGGASPDWLRAPSRELARILPRGRHLSLEGQTHGADPAVLAPVLVEFFTSASPRNGSGEEPG